MYCGEEVMGVKLHRAICKGPQMYSLMSLRHTALLNQSIYMTDFDVAAIKFLLSNS